VLTVEIGLFHLLDQAEGTLARFDQKLAVEGLQAWLGLLLRGLRPRARHLDGNARSHTGRLTTQA
jgi:hypothetical protein